jgi:hypothetical protein
MPRKANRQAPPRESKPTAKAPERAEEKGPPKTEVKSPIEEGLELWARFARETGETVTEYLRRFGEEQQKNYESWMSSVRDATKPSPRSMGTEELTARIEEWNRRAQEVGERIRDAFLKTMEPQKELLDLWVKPFLPKDATAQDSVRESMELIQKMWSGLTTDMTRIMFTALQPRQSVEELTRVQDASLKEFYDSFKKLTQLYFTSPAFVTMFGRTLDASLDTERWERARERYLGWMTWLPSRQEITQLNEAIRDLGDKVGRLHVERL